MKVILSAFSCDPTKGSEPSNGWNWAFGLANHGYEVHCFTRIVGKEGIEHANKPESLIFHYVKLPLWGEGLYNFSSIGMYLYYIIWQWIAYKKAKRIHKEIVFDVAHHVTWGSTQMGSFMYKLKIPFIFGPAGGGQVAPVVFKEYFRNYWDGEVKREKLSKFLLRYNPACRKMLNNSSVVLVSNPDTEHMVKYIGAKKVIATLDAALPSSFFPDKLPEPIVKPNKLRLLWVGRFMPRKGLLLLLDVMKELKGYKGITLTVVGDGEMREQFLDLVQQYQLTDLVDWVGKVPYELVKSYYMSHDVFIFTSLRDSCPAQLIEAMACSLPVITINLHGQAVIVNDDTGIVCECIDVDSTISNLKEAILSFRDNPELRLQKGRSAYNFAIQQSWDKKIDNIIEQCYPIV